MELNWGSRHTWQDGGPVSAPVPQWPVLLPGQPPPPAPPRTDDDSGTSSGTASGTDSGTDYDYDNDNGADYGNDNGTEVVASPLPAPATSGSRPLLREVSFRTRISLLVGVAVGVAVAMAALVSYVAVSRQLEQQANSNLQSAVDLVPSLVRFVGPGQLNPAPFINFQLRTGDQVQALIAEDQGGPQIFSVDAQQDTMPERTFFKLTPAARQTLTSSSSAVPIQTVQGQTAPPTGWRR